MILRYKNQDNDANLESTKTGNRKQKKNKDKTTTKLQTSPKANTTDTRTYVQQHIQHTARRNNIKTSKSSAD